MKKHFFDNLCFFLSEKFKVFVIQFKDIVELGFIAHVKWKKGLIFIFFDLKAYRVYFDSKDIFKIIQDKVFKREREHIPCFLENIDRVRWCNKVGFYSHEIEIIFFFLKAKNLRFERLKSTPILLYEEIVGNLFCVGMIEFFDVERTISSWTRSPLDKPE